MYKTKKIILLSCFLFIISIIVYVLAAVPTIIDVRSNTYSVHTNESFTGYCTATDSDNDPLNYHVNMYINGILNYTVNNVATKDVGNFSQFSSLGMVENVSEIHVRVASHIMPPEINIINSTHGLLTYLGDTNDVGANLFMYDENYSITWMSPTYDVDTDRYGSSAFYNDFDLIDETHAIGVIGHYSEYRIYIIILEWNSSGNFTEYDGGLSQIETARPYWVSAVSMNANHSSVTRQLDNQIYFHNSSDNYKFKRINEDPGKYRMNLDKINSTHVLGIGGYGSANECYLYLYYCEPDYSSCAYSSSTVPHDTGEDGCEYGDLQVIDENEALIVYNEYSDGQYKGKARLVSWNSAFTVTYGDTFQYSAPFAPESGTGRAYTNVLKEIPNQDNYSIVSYIDENNIQHLRIISWLNGTLDYGSYDFLPNITTTSYTGGVYPVSKDHAYVTTTSDLIYLVNWTFESLYHPNDYEKELITINSSQTSKYQNWTFECLVDDGTTNSSQNSSIIEILNTDPTDPTDITGIPARLYIGDSLTVNATGGTDLDNDTIIGYAFKFYNVDDSITVQNWSTNNTYIINETDIDDVITVYAKTLTSDANSTGEYNENTSVIFGYTISVPFIDKFDRDTGSNLSNNWSEKYPTIGDWRIDYNSTTQNGVLVGYNNISSDTIELNLYLNETYNSSQLTIEWDAKFSKFGAVHTDRLLCDTGSNCPQYSSIILYNTTDNEITNHYMNQYVVSTSQQIIHYAKKGPYNSDVWFHYRMIMDLENGTMDMYENNTLLVANMTDTDLLNGETNRIKLRLTESGSGTLQYKWYIDNFQIYSERTSPFGIGDTDTDLNNIPYITFPFFDDFNDIERQGLSSKNLDTHYNRSLGNYLDLSEDTAYIGVTNNQFISYGLNTGAPCCTDTKSSWQVLFEETKTTGKVKIRWLHNSSWNIRSGFDTFDYQTQRQNAQQKLYDRLNYNNMLLYHRYTGIDRYTEWCYQNEDSGVNQQYLQSNVAANWTIILDLDLNEAKLYYNDEQKLSACPYNEGFSGFRFDDDYGSGYSHIIYLDNLYIVEESVFINFPTTGYVTDEETVELNITKYFNSTCNITNNGVIEIQDVIINDSINNGNFLYEITLTDGENIVNVSCTDEAEASINITYNEPEEIILPSGASGSVSNPGGGCGDGYFIFEQQCVKGSIQKYFQYEMFDNAVCSDSKVLWRLNMLDQDKRKMQVDKVQFIFAGHTYDMVYTGDMYTYNNYLYMPSIEDYIEIDQMGLRKFVVCLDGYTIKIDENKLDTFIEQGAMLGECNSSINYDLDSGVTYVTFYSIQEIDGTKYTITDTEKVILNIDCTRLSTQKFNLLASKVGDEVDEVVSFFKGWNEKTTEEKQESAKNLLPHFIIIIALTIFIISIVTMLWGNTG